MNEVKKYCVDCKTTKTPLWRAGPHGPRSLCNACGIRYRKRKMADEKQQPTSVIKRERSSDSKCDDFNFDFEDENHEPLKMRYDYRMSVRVQKSSSLTSSSSSSLSVKKQRSNSERSISSSDRNFGEVEQAAVLLMSLSCGSVFA